MFGACCCGEGGQEAEVINYSPLEEAENQPTLMYGVEEKAADPKLAQDCAQAEEDQVCWQCEIEKFGGPAWGFSYETGHVYLLITEVDPDGPVARYNAQAAPSKRIMPQDAVLSVNGEQETRPMLTEIKRPGGKLSLQLSRPTKLEISISRAGSDPWGITAVFTPGEPGMLVSRIKPDAEVASYNKGIHEIQQLLDKDIILRVNGNDVATDMIGILKDSKVNRLDMLVLRIPQAKA